MTVAFDLLRRENQRLAKKLAEFEAFGAMAVSEEDRAKERKLSERIERNAPILSYVTESTGPKLHRFHQPQRLSKAVAKEGRREHEQVGPLKRLFNMGRGRS